MTARSSAILAWVVDVILVCAFGIIGRASHGEDASQTPAVILPFFAALQVGWLLRSGSRPHLVKWSGVIIWGATVILGLVLRAATGQGIVLSFAIVATLVLAVFLLGWRAVLALVLRVRARR